jgi:hypothetical protein
MISRILSHETGIIKIRQYDKQFRFQYGFYELAPH